MFNSIIIVNWQGICFLFFVSTSKPEKRAGGQLPRSFWGTQTNDTSSYSLGSILPFNKYMISLSHSTYLHFRDKEPDTLSRVTQP